MKWLLEKLGVQNRAELLPLLWQFIKFGIIGTSNTIVSTSIYYLFIWIDPRLYFVGNVAGWIVSVFNSFLEQSVCFYEIRVFLGTEAAADISGLRRQFPCRKRDACTFGQRSGRF